MRTALDFRTDQLDAQELRFRDKIGEHGWFSTSGFAEGEHPGFTYSTSFSPTLAAPEMIVFVAFAAGGRRNPSFRKGRRGEAASSAGSREGKLARPPAGVRLIRG